MTTSSSSVVSSSWSWRKSASGVAVTLAIAITVLTWSSAFVAIRAALLGGYSPLHLLALRTLVAATVLGSVAYVAGVRLPAHRDVPALLFLGLTGFVLYGALLNAGERSVTATAASFLVSTVPAITAVLAGIALGERLARRAWLGVLVSLVGAGLIALGEGDSASIDWGAALVLGAALCQSTFFIAQKRLLARYRPFELTIYAAMGAALCVIGWLPGALRDASTLPRGATAAAVYLGVVPTAGYAAYAYALSRLPASRATAFLYLIPVASLPIAWLWLGEAPHGVALVGGAVALAGVVLVHIRS